jgi:EmrB/QacA subfamily drug resistance transporter
MDRSGPAVTDRRALAAVCLGFFMVLLDGSALNIALPTIQHEVNGTIAAAQWVINIYTIPLAAFLLTAGHLSDRLGARRLFLWSLGLFTLASLLCAVSPTLGFLIVTRGLQGIAAGGLLPTTLAIITRTYTDSIERAKAITVWGGTGGLALVLGPVGGGVLTDVLGWRAIFVINVPVGIVTAVLAWRHVRETDRRPGTSLDLPGQLTGIVALSALVAALIEGGELGWTAAPTLGLIAVAATATAAFLVIERHGDHPMLPLTIFRRHAFTASVVSGFAFQFAGYGMQFVLAVYLQQHWHTGATETGLLFLPFSVAWLVGTAVLNRCLVRRGSRWLLWTGATCALVGALLTLGVTGPASVWLLLAGTGLAGLGCGVFAPSLSAAAMLSVDPRFAGLGSGVLNTARQVGMAVGVALLGALIAIPDSRLGLRAGLAVIALCFLSIVLLSLRYVPREGSAGADNGR